MTFLKCEKIISDENKRIKQLNSRYPEIFIFLYICSWQYNCKYCVEIPNSCMAALHLSVIKLNVEQECGSKILRSSKERTSGTIYLSGNNSASIKFFLETIGDLKHLNDNKRQWSSGSTYYKMRRMSHTKKQNKFGKKTFSSTWSKSSDTVFMVATSLEA